jgi:hypothetical protein
MCGRTAKSWRRNPEACRRGKEQVAAVKPCVAHVRRNDDGSSATHELEEHVRTVGISRGSLRRVLAILNGAVSRGSGMTLESIPRRFKAMPFLELESQPMHK